MKVIVIIFVIIALTISGALAYSYYQDAFVIRRELEQERYMRILAEESEVKIKKQMVSLEVDFDKQAKKLKSTRKLLKHSEASKTDLKKKLKRVQRIRETLDKKIKKLKQKELKQVETF